MSKQIERYTVYVNGQHQSKHLTQAAAIAHALQYPNDLEVSVVMHVQSGTYKSRTRVWPSLGTTYTI